MHLSSGGSGGGGCHTAATAGARVSSNFFCGFTCCRHRLSLLPPPLGFWLSAPVVVAALPPSLVAPTRRRLPLPLPLPLPLLLPLPLPSTPCTRKAYSSQPPLQLPPLSPTWTCSCCKSSCQSCSSCAHRTVPTEMKCPASACAASR
jgi:hypothetical protein